ncbi:16S rRNA (cytidine(1402)-2'-O)-methyltransferase [Aciduricibacillus chroicocephali]|uniref:Ribosomal RNA small subunit methyltransferase I n=1 Tax=Aciduricibacillus chroicocephali TaxID=3054939 RepID=A0ABY9KV30_9BACI|nr:16S rRNA (cytidine(1402)-2'-O)-methyltransferase [Bacillaceae bacterium 44XB]
MQVQKSYQNEQETGSLYIVPTPIGNLEDITYRALNILKEADLIAAEDTRNTKRLLNHFEISSPLVSYHEHNKLAREGQLLEKLRSGSLVAIVSDAGMPAISDPGHEIVHAAIAEGIPVVVLPGANAAICALVGSGLETQAFTFYGFLPRKKKERNGELERLGKLSSTLLFYESPHRLKETLHAMHDVLGSRQAALARELTKKFEEYIRGSLEELVSWAEANEPRGEFCIVVEGNPFEETEEPGETWWAELTMVEHVDTIMRDKGLSNKDAIKEAARERRLPKRDVYQAYHVEQ